MVLVLNLDSCCYAQLFDLSLTCVCVNEIPPQNTQVFMNILSACMVMSGDGTCTPGAVLLLRVLTVVNTVVQ